MKCHSAMWSYLLLPVLHVVMYVVTARPADFTADVKDPYLWFNVVVLGPALGVLTLATAPEEGRHWPVVLVIPLYDTLFYWLHRAAHRWFLGLHHHHHRFLSTNNRLSAFYAHPLEHLLVNVGPLLLIFHLLELAAMWRLLSLVYGTWSREPDNRHGLHHRYFTCNYGNWSWWDRWCGTEKCTAYLGVRVTRCGYVGSSGPSTTNMYTYREEGEPAFYLNPTSNGWNVWAQEPFDSTYDDTDRIPLTWEQASELKAMYRQLRRNGQLCATLVPLPEPVENL